MSDPTSAGRGHLALHVYYPQVLQVRLKTYCIAQAQPTPMGVSHVSRRRHCVVLSDASWASPPSVSTLDNLVADGQVERFPGRPGRPPMLTPATEPDAASRLLEILASGSRGASVRVRPGRQSCWPVPTEENIDYHAVTTPLLRAPQSAQR